MVPCPRGHSHETEDEREACDAQALDASALLKMAQVGFSGPGKLPRHHLPARSERRGDLEVYVFSEEEIIPWSAREE